MINRSPLGEVCAVLAKSKGCGDNKAASVTNNPATSPSGSWTPPDERGCSSLSRVQTFNSSAPRLRGVRASHHCRPQVEILTSWSSRWSCRVNPLAATFRSSTLTSWAPPWTRWRLCASAATQHPDSSTPGQVHPEPPGPYDPEMRKLLRHFFVDEELSQVWAGRGAWNYPFSIDCTIEGRAGIRYLAPAAGSNNPQTKGNEHAYRHLLNCRVYSNF